MAIRAPSPPRAIYFGLAIATIAIGLVVHSGAVGLGPTARDVVGDVLWAAMLVWWAAVLVPRVSRWKRYAGAYAWCVLIEFSQRYHTPTLDALRDTRLGHLVLGRGFDPRDLLSYALGVTAAALVDGMLTFRRR